MFSSVDSFTLPAKFVTSFQAMNQSLTDQAADLLKTIAHPIRLRIVLALAEESSLKVSALQKHLQLEQSLVSHHLTKMKDRDILSSKRQGNEVYYALSNASLRKALPFLINSAVVKGR